MDEQLRRNERRARLEGDRSASLRQARDLWRAGCVAEARYALYERFARRRFDSETLLLLRDLGVADGRIGEARGGERLRAHVNQVARGPAGEAMVVPGLAFVGLPGSEAARVVEGLVDVLGHGGRVALPGERLRTFRVSGGERVVDFRAPLAAPWRASAGYLATRLRVFNVPGASEASKNRRALLRSVSALVIVAGAEGDDPGLRELAQTLDRELRWVGGVGLKGLPVLVLYPSTDQAERHEARASALGLSRAGWGVRAPHASTQAEGAGELLALLLLEVREGLRRLVRPRGSA